MSRIYKIGQKIFAIRESRACNSYGQLSGDIIDKGAKGIVTAYNDKFTDETLDDLVKIKITSGDNNLVGKEIWIKSNDFNKIIKQY